MTPMITAALANLQHAITGSNLMTSIVAMDTFLAAQQRRLFVTARLATRNDDEALDLVQDAMLQLASHYMDKPAGDWPALIQRILQNKIKDWHRKQKVRSILFWWQQQDLDEDILPIDNQQTNHRSPDHYQQTQQLQTHIRQALESLPMRQQQAFLLRAWYEHSTEDTAVIMGCSQGSVKTHYSRATKALANLLMDGDPQETTP